MTTPADRLAALAGDTTAKPIAPTPVAPKVVAPFTGIRVIPYSAARHDDAQNFLPWMWNKLKADDLVELYFPGQTQTGFADFCKLMSGDGAKILLVVTEDAAGNMGDAVGFASSALMPLGAGNGGIGGFIFFKEFWDSKTTVEAARQIMHHWFHENGYEIMLGCVAELNHLANQFLHKMGWTRVGSIPKLHYYYGKECPSVVWQITKEHYLAMEAGK